MDQTPKLSLPFIMPNQASKHVTYNEGVKRLDALIQLSVVSTTQSAQPIQVEDGNAYILPENASGENWTGQPAGTIASFLDGAWSFDQPKDGWRAWDKAASQLLVYTLGIWKTIETGGGAFTEQLPNFGINTTADDTNRLAVKSDSELLSHDDVTPGSGDARKIINKAAPERTASVLFQTAFTGFAEIGLTGDDDLRFRVGGTDGNTFLDAAVFDRATARAKFPAGTVHAQTNTPIAQPLFVEGEAGFRPIYRIDVPRAANPRQYTLASVSGSTLILTEAKTAEIFLNNFMEGLSYLRIWNTSKAPAQSAWVVRTSGTDRLDIKNPADLAGWQSGDTIQMGDPLDVTPGRCIALDISPMLELAFGEAFPQSGLTAKIIVVGNGGQAGLDVSPSGIFGSYQNVRSQPDGGFAAVQVTIPCFARSDTSNSNLVFVRENTFGGLCGPTSVTTNIIFG